MLKCHSRHHKVNYIVLRAFVIFCIWSKVLLISNQLYISVFVSLIKSSYINQIFQITVQVQHGVEDEDLFVFCNDEY